MSLLPLALYLRQTRNPVYDFSFVYHGGVWFKGPWGIIGDQWTQRKVRSVRGRVPGILPNVWSSLMRSPGQQDAAWQEYLETYGDSPSRSYL